MIYYFSSDHFNAENSSSNSSGFKIWEHRVLKNYVKNFIIRCFKGSGTKIRLWKQVYHSNEIEVCCCALFSAVSKYLKKKILFYVYQRVSSNLQQGSALSCKYLQQNQYTELRKVDFQNFSTGDQSSSNFSLKLKNFG